MHFRLVTLANSPRFYVEWRENGSKRRVSTRTADRTEAESFLAAFRLEYLEEAASEWPSVVAILQWYYDAHASKKASAYQAEIAIEHLKAFWGDTLVNGASMAKQARYAEERLALGRSSETVNRELSVMSAAFRRAARFEKLPGQAPAIFSLPQKDARERFLTRDEAAKLLAHFRRTPRTKHLLLFSRLALYTGARSGAILGLTWDRVNLERGIIDYRKGPSTAKGRSVVPISPGLVRALTKAKRSAKSDHVIEWKGEPVKRVVRAFTKHCDAIGLEGVSPNTLRHTFGTWAAQSGASLFLVARAMGHKRVSTTERYAKHETDSLKGVMSAVRRGK